MSKGKKKADENLFAVGVNWQNVPTNTSNVEPLSSKESKAKEFYGKEGTNSSLQLSSFRKSDSSFLRTSFFSKSLCNFDLEFTEYKETYEIEVRAILSDFSFKRLKSFCEEKEFSPLKINFRIVVTDFKIKNNEQSNAGKKSGILYLRSKCKLILKELSKHLVRIGLQINVPKEEKPKFSSKF